MTWLYCSNKLDAEVQLQVKAPNKWSIIFRVALPAENASKGSFKGRRSLWVTRIETKPSFSHTVYGKLNPMEAKQRRRKNEELSYWPVATEAKELPSYVATITLHTKQTQRVFRAMRVSQHHCLRRSLRIFTIIAGILSRWVLLSFNCWLPWQDAENLCVALSSTALYCLHIRNFRILKYWGVRVVFLFLFNFGRPHTHKKTALGQPGTPTNSTQLPLTKWTTAAQESSPPRTRSRVIICHFTNAKTSRLFRVCADNDRLCPNGSGK